MTLEDRVIPSAAGQEARFPGHRPHDHRRCVREALATATALCQRRGARLTDIRRRVLEMIWESHQPVTAYDLLSRLSQERGRTAPPTVYRALDFLSAQGLIHRLESLNAFIGCNRADHSHDALFLICTGCGEVAEQAEPGLDALLARLADGRGFQVEQRVVELRGLCPDCRDASTEDRPADV